MIPRMFNSRFGTKADPWGERYFSFDLCKANTNEIFQASVSSPGLSLSVSFLRALGGCRQDDGQEENRNEATTTVGNPDDTAWTKRCEALGEGFDRACE